MTASHPPTWAARLARPGVLGGITLLLLVSFVVPLLGLVISLAVPVATHATRHHLWPRTSTAASLIWSWVAWAGLWWPGSLSIFAPFDGTEGEGGGMVVSTIWLVIPLCAPTTAAVLLPAVAVAASALAGLVGAAATARVWVWVAALWLAPWVHHGVFSLVGPGHIC